LRISRSLCKLRRISPREAGQPILGQALRVKWFERSSDPEPVEVEKSIDTDLDGVVALGRAALVDMRSGHMTNPPSGFVVVDPDGNEVRRWFEPPSVTA
jgi:hypothetical protein